MAFVPTATPLFQRHARVSLSRGRAPCFHAPIRTRVIMSVSGIENVADVTLPATEATGSKLSLSEAGAEGKLVVLYFYPKDSTPGCTTEAKDFRDAKDELTALGATVIGVSRDSLESHEDFSKKESLNFPLIADDGKLTETFDVWKERSMFGKTFMGIERSTFILRDGEIVKEWRGIKAPGHAANVIAAVKEIVEGGD